MRPQRCGAGGGDAAIGRFVAHDAAVAGRPDQLLQFVHGNLMKRMRFEEILVLQVADGVRVGAVGPDDLVFARVGVLAQHALGVRECHTLGIVEADVQPVGFFRCDPVHGLQERRIPGLLDRSLKDAGDLDRGRPFDLFLASIATCAGIYVKGYCDARHIATDELELRMEVERDEKGRRVARLALEIVLPEGFPEKHRDAVARAADVVVMGAVARNRWKRLFIGATAERTLEDLPCDLLIIKPDWFQTPVELEGHEAA